jgi:peptide/nickel transport system permease protein
VATLDAVRGLTPPPRQARTAPRRSQAVLRSLLQRPGTFLSLAFLALVVISAVAAPLLAPNGPDAQIATPFLGPSPAHPFGTDQLGRDLLSRLMYGGQVSLATAAGSALLAAAIGVPVGLVAGYAGGLLDAVLMRLMDLLLSIPGVLLALVVVAMLGPSNGNVLIAIALVSAPAFARLARAGTLSAKETDYVLAARGMGASPADILVRTVLPNVSPPLLVQLMLTAALAILISASLAFLGLGVKLPAATWGALIHDGRDYLYQSPWYGVFPGLVLTLTIAAFDQLGRGIGAALGVSGRQHQKGAML